MNKKAIFLVSFLVIGFTASICAMDKDRLNEQKLAEVLGKQIVTMREGIGKKLSEKKEDNRGSRQLVALDIPDVLDMSLAEKISKLEEFCNEKDKTSHFKYEQELLYAKQLLSTLCEDKIVFEGNLVALKNLVEIIDKNPESCRNQFHDENDFLYVKGLSLALYGISIEDDKVSFNYTPENLQNLRKIDETKKVAAKNTAWIGTMKNLFKADGTMIFKDGNTLGNKKMPKQEDWRKKYQALASTVKWKMFFAFFAGVGLTATCGVFALKAWFGKSLFSLNFN